MAADTTAPRTIYLVVGGSQELSGPHTRAAAAETARVYGGRVVAYHRRSPKRVRRSSR